MKTIFCICIAVIGLLFVYNPVVDLKKESASKTLKKVELAPELQQCEIYRKKIEANLKQAEQK